MKKKVLFSILAMTSASTMTAYADANIDQPKTDSVEDWMGATSDVTVLNGVITSPKGTPVSQSIGKLVKGNYKLSFTGNNAKVTYNGKELDPDGTFTLDAETEVIIRIEAISTGSQYTVQDFKLELIHDFAPDAAYLTKRLAEVQNKLKEGSPGYEELNLEVSRISGLISAIKNDAEGEFAAYDLYVKYELYNGAENSTIINEINELETKINESVGAFDLYNTSNALYNTYKTRFDNATNDMESIAEAGTKTYAGKISAGAKTAASKILNDFKTSIDEALKGEEGSVSDACSPEKNEAFEAAAKKEIEAYENAIEGAKIDWPAHRDVKEIIDRLKKDYDAALQEIYNTLKGDDTHEDVFEGMRTEAQTALNNIFVKILEVEKTNGSDDNCVGASDHKDDNLANLTACKQELTDTKTKYVTKANTIKRNYTDAMGEVTRLEEQVKILRGNKDVSAKFGEEISKIENAINELKDKIDSDYKDLSIETSGYTEETAEIQASIDHIKGEADGVFDNFEAYESVKASIKKVQTTFDEAKKEVNALTSEDKQYKAEGKYTAKEDGIQASISKFGQDAEAAYTNGTCVAWEEENSAGITAVNSTISSYKTAAEQALSDYEAIRKAVTSYKNAIEGLDEKVGMNTNVTVYAETPATYGDKIKEFNTAVTKIENAKTAALAKSGDEHATALADARKLADASSTIPADVQTLISSFDADKEKYDVDVVENAVNALLNQADKKIESATGTLKKDEPKKEEVGIAYDTLKDEYDRLSAAITLQKDKVDGARDEADKAEAMAMLSEVNTAISEIIKEISEYGNDVADAKKSVTDNKNKLNDANATVEKTRKNIVGKPDENIKGITDLNEDTNRDTEFSDLAQSLTGELEALKTAIEAACKAETLVSGWADSKDDDGKVVKGFDTQLQELSAKVEEARGKAETSTLNWKAYEEIAASIPKIQETLDNAPAGIDAAVTGDEARTHYKNRVTEDLTLLNTISSDARKAYDERKLSEEEGEKKTLNTRIENLKKNADSIVSDAKTNESTHNNQETEYEKVKERWSEVYYEILTGDQTSLVKDYLKRLIDEQTRLSTVHQEISDYYNGGRSKEMNEDINAALNDIYAEINKIAEEQKGGHDTAVTNDNTARYNRFLEAYDEAFKAFDAAVDTISQYNALTNADLVGSATQAVIDANSDINGILTSLRELKTKADSDKQNTISPDLFDATEKYKAEAEGYTEKIHKAIDNLDNAVSGVAREKYSTQFSDANTALENAIKEIENSNYTESVIEAAFSDVREIVERAESSIDVNTEHFALKVDELLTELATVKDRIETGKTVAAEAEYTAELTAAQEKMEKELADLNKYEYINDTDGQIKQGFINRYNAAVEKYINGESGAIKKYAGTAKDDLYKDFASIQSLFTSFMSEATSIYEDATTAKGNQAVNTESYNSMKEMLAELQAELDEAVRFAETYVITTDCGQTAVQDFINAQLALIDQKFTDGSCASYVVQLKGLCEDKSITIESIYVNANNKESTRIEAEIESLKGDQNKAANAVKDDEEKSKEVDAYTQTISGLAEEYGKKIISEEFLALDNMGKQKVYLSYEKKIADIRAELSAYYDSQIAETTYTALTEKLGEVRTAYEAETETLDGCHANVKRDFSSKLTAFGTSVDELMAEIDSRKTENTILFYNNKLSYGIDELGKELASLTKEIADAQAPYTANDEAYAKLSGQLTELQTSLNTMVEKLSGYKYYNIQEENAQKALTDIQTLIDADKNFVEETNAEWKLTASSELANKTTVENAIAKFDKNATFNELSLNISAGYGESLQSLYTEVANIIRNSKYTDEMRGELTRSLSNIYMQLNNLLDYNENAYRGYIFKDIDGVEIKEGNVKGRQIDYMSEAVDPIKERISKLTEDMAALKTDATEQAYILGDVDRDKHVLVNDYMDIIDIALGKTETETGSLKFLAADANEDGNINVGDLTAVTNTILYGSDGRASMSGAMKAAPAANGTADAIELTAEDNDGVKVIAVNLKNVRTYVSMQLDVKIPSGVTLLSETLGERADGHVIYSNTMADGTHRIIVSSMENSAFTAAEGAVIHLEVSGKAAEKITVSNVIASDATGTAYSIDGNGDGTTGIEGVNADKSLKEKIYSVGGQMMKGIKRGINIIRNSDGTSKKVIGK